MKADVPTCLKWAAAFSLAEELAPCYQVLSILKVENSDCVYVYEVSDLKVRKNSNMSTCYSG